MENPFFLFISVSAESRAFNVTTQRDKHTFTATTKQMLINVLGKFLSVCKLVRFNSTRIELHATMSLKFYVYSYHIFIHFHLFLASKMHTRFSRSRLFSTKYITICEQLNIFLLSPRLHFFVYKLCCNKAYFIALLLLNERTVFKLLHFIWNYNNFTN